MSYLDSLRAAGVQADVRMGPGAVGPTTGATKAIAAKLLRDLIAWVDADDNLTYSGIPENVRWFAAERGIDLEASDE